MDMANTNPISHVERDSWKDEIIVKSFILVVVGLLLAIVLKPRIDRWRVSDISRYGCNVDVRID